jgi:ABC-type Fe3+ transport system substrate-binding protein
MNSEERIVVYGSLGLRRGISDLLWAFRKSGKMEEFPAYLDDHPFQVMSRVRQERKFGMKTADVVLMPHYAVNALGEEGVLSRYRPKGEGRRLGIEGPKIGSNPVGVTFMAMAYNTHLVRAGTLPSSLSSLGSPRWKGRLGTQSLTASRSGNLGVWYLAFLRTKVGEKKWRSFVESLKASNVPRAYDCIDHLMQGLVGKEVSLALTVYSLAYFREKAGGSPVELVPTESIPHMMTFTSAGLLTESEDSPAAKRFMDFLMTPGAQKIIGGIPGIAPIAKGLPASYDFEHEYGAGTEFHPGEKEARDVREVVELFRDLGLP